MSATLQDKITASLSVLASTQTSHLMSALGLLTIAPLLAPGGGDGTPLSTVPGMMSGIMCRYPMVTVPGCHPAAIVTLSGRLDSWLAAPDLLLLPATRLLVSSAHRRHVATQSQGEVVRTYTSLHTAVMETSNGYEAGILNKTPEQLSQLLQL